MDSSHLNINPGEKSSNVLFSIASYLKTINGDFRTLQLQKKSYDSSTTFPHTSVLHDTPIRPTTANISVPKLLPQTLAYSTPRPLYKLAKAGTKTEFHKDKGKELDAREEPRPSNWTSSGSLEADIKNIKMQIEKTLSQYTTFTHNTKLKERELLIEKHLSALKIASPLFYKTKHFIPEFTIAQNPIYLKSYSGELVKDADFNPIVGVNFKELLTPSDGVNNEPDPYQDHDVIIQKYKIPIRNEDLLTLRHGMWLNDEVIM